MNEQKLSSCGAHCCTTSTAQLGSLQKSCIGNALDTAQRPLVTVTRYLQLQTLEGLTHISRPSCNTPATVHHRTTAFVLAHSATDEISQQQRLMHVRLHIAVEQKQEAYNSHAYDYETMQRPLPHTACPCQMKVRLVLLTCFYQRDFQLAQNMNVYR